MIMEIPFLDKWRKWQTLANGVSVMAPEGALDLFAECDLLRAQASAVGIELDDTVASLELLDQLPPRWRDDPDVLSWLGNDAGLYLGTVIVRTVPGAVWQVWPNGQPVVRLASGRELDVVATGHDWAESGTPELSQLYLEASER
jgi:hypothetical protein